MTYDSDLPIPAPMSNSRVQPIIAVCVGGPHHNVKLTVYPSDNRDPVGFVSRYSNGEYTYQAETEEYAACFMWRDYE